MMERFGVVTCFVGSRGCFLAARDGLKMWGRGKWGRNGDP